MLAYGTPFSICLGHGNRVGVQSERDRHGSFIDGRDIFYGWGCQAGQTLVGVRAMGTRCITPKPRTPFLDVSQMYGVFSAPIGVYAGQGPTTVAESGCKLSARCSFDASSLPLTPRQCSSEWFRTPIPSIPDLI